MTDSRDRAERYRLAWLSARQGRRNWQKLYEYAQGKWWLLDKQNVNRGYHDLMMHAYRSQVAHLEALLEDRERELADLRLAFSEAEGAKAREGESASESAPLA